MTFNFMLDLDNCIADCGSALVRHFQENYGLGIGYDVYNGTEFKLSHAIPGVTWENHIRPMFNTESFWKDMPQLQGAYAFVESLRTLGNVHIATSRPYDAAILGTYYWLNKHGIVCTSLNFVENPKVEFCQRHDIDIAFEDSATNAPALAAAGFQVILSEWGYNRHLSDPNIHRHERLDFDGMLETTRILMHDMRFSRADALTLATIR